MKKVFIVVAAIIANFSMSSYTVASKFIKEHGGNPWVFYESISAWHEATEYETFYIYYKEGNGVRKYAVFMDRNADECPSCGVENIFYNGCFNDPNCNDYREAYQYKVVFPDGMTYYFNCYLPYREKSKYSYVYYANIIAWNAATTSDIYFIFYEEGNGERKYYVLTHRNIEECPGCGKYNIDENSFYKNPNCTDYRKNYRYKVVFPDGMTYYFNCDLQ